MQAGVILTNDVVALYNALGGGWKKDTASSQAPVIATTSPATPAVLDIVAGGAPRQAISRIAGMLRCSFSTEETR